MRQRGRTVINAGKNNEVSGLLTVVPSQPDEKTGLVLTRGTQVLIDGKKVSGVTKVVLTAEPNDVWRARVECFVSLTTMPGMLVEVENTRRLSWWRKMLLRIAGVDVDGAVNDSESRYVTKNVK